ncbi:alpha/beta fold hydrolase [Endozoicomonas arenosclerae]|uniref:alpha/beta fold hydrolase n=1 Tax=Endozoicomonas arenosclerae TaxID=1633495 RepID=UPI0009A17D7E|nr:alpha/beta hydrolase [Endozoicomonas arenosclerae]
MMSKDSIHFCHANGFPAPVYRRFLTSLEESFRIQYLECHGHNPRYPVSNHWSELVDELIEQLERRYDEPVIGLGHSFGGVITWFASRLRPDLYKAVLLLDAPLMTPLDSSVLRVAKKFGVMDRITPSGRAAERKSEWNNRQEALDYFRTKSLFSDFDERCLEDYVDLGLHHHSDGLKLKFDPAVESAIFASSPDRFPKAEKKRVPAAMLYGENSDILSRRRVFVHRYLTGLEMKSTAGGHLFPLEFPEVAASSVQAMIERLTGESYGA